MSRRRVLAALGLAPAVLILPGCTLGTTAADGPDPLIALADAARADAALAAAVAAADPALAERVLPLRDARTEHAAALDAEIARLDPDADPTAPSADAVPAAPAGDATLPALRTAVTDSGAAAAAVTLDVPAERVALVAAVAACCTTYAAVLG